jgi:hypothetical protein
VIGALAVDGVVAGMSIPAATSTTVFLASTEQVLVPALRDRPGALDRGAIEGRGQPASSQSRGGPGGARPIGRSAVDGSPIAACRPWTAPLSSAGSEPD